MSLLCVETRELIPFGAALYCGNRKDGATMCILSHGVVDMIPAELRRPEPCATEKDGVDIHRASAGGPTLRGGYDGSSLQKGRFLFSVSPETATQLLPLLWQHTGAGAAESVPEIRIRFTLFGPRPPRRRG